MIDPSIRWFTTSVSWYSIVPTKSFQSHVILYAQHIHINTYVHMDCKCVHNRISMHKYTHLHLCTNLCMQHVCCIGQITRGSNTMYVHKTTCCIARLEIIPILEDILCMATAWLNTAGQCPNHLNSDGTTAQPRVRKNDKQHFLFLDGGGQFKVNLSFTKICWCNRDNSSTR